MFNSIVYSLEELVVYALADMVTIVVGSEAVVEQNQPRLSRRREGIKTTIFVFYFVISRDSV